MAERPNYKPVNVLQPQPLDNQGKNQNVSRETSPQDRLAQAFLTISEFLASGHNFTSAQKDLGLQLSMNALPPGEQEWFQEVATANRVPLWMALWAQWRRTTEWGVSAALLLDPGWSEDELGELKERECPICNKMFQPVNWGQIYESNECGAEAERRANPRPVVEEAET